MRIRVCGICVDHDLILLVGHRLPGHLKIFWSVPGGGIQFGETSREALVREFFEETGLRVEIGEMLFFNEFIQPPLHAIELFFKIDSFEGTLISGIDPEFSDNNQLIQQTGFMSMGEIKEISKESKHSIFRDRNSVEEILDLRGYLIDGSTLHR